MGKWAAYILTMICLACVPVPSTEYGNSDNTALKYQKSQQNDISSTRRILILRSILSEVNEKDTILPFVLYSLSRNYYSLKRYDSVNYYGRLLIDGVKTKENLVNLGKYYHLQGHYHEKFTTRFDSSYYYHDLAKKTYLQCGDTARAFKRIVRLAYLQQFQGDYFGAKETLTQALSLQQYTQDSYNYASFYNQLGIVHMELENIPEAQNFYKKAIANTNSPKHRIGYQNNYGVALLEADQNLKAKVIFNDMLQDSLIQKDSLRLAKAIQNLGYAKWKMGVPEAILDFNRAYAISTSLNDLNGLIFSHKRYGEYYADISPSRAIKHFDTSIVLAKKLGRPRLEQDALEFLLKIAPKNIAYKNRFIRLTDSLYKQELQVKTQFAYLKYQDQQEKQQLLEFEASTARQEAELAQQEKQKILIVSFSSLALAGGFLFFFFIKQRHKREKLKVMYNTEKRISRELHDGLANDIFGLMTQIQSTKKSDSELLDCLDNIYQTTRNISHENAPIKTGVHFEAELQLLTDTYQDASTTILVKGLTNADWPRLNSHTCIAVHRAIRELLVNMKKHAKASLVLLQFEMNDNNLTITYRDNGIGFSTKKPHGLGLRNTESRIKAVGGIINFDSMQEQGTQITFNIPI